MYNKDMGYDIRFRKRAVEYRKEGHTIEETAKIFKIGTATLKSWIKQYDETGSLENKPLNRGFKKLDPAKLKAYIEEHPDAFLSEIADVFCCSSEAVRKAFKRLGITRKKRQNVTESKSQKR